MPVTQLFLEDNSSHHSEWPPSPGEMGKSKRVVSDEILINPLWIGHFEQQAVCYLQKEKSLGDFLDKFL